jgi:hypothetical protein
MPAAHALAHASTSTAPRSHPADTSHGNAMTAARADRPRDTASIRSIRSIAQLTQELRNSDGRRDRAVRDLLSTTPAAAAGGAAASLFSAESLSNGPAAAASSSHAAAGYPRSGWPSTPVGPESPTARRARCPRRNCRPRA